MNFFRNTWSDVAYFAYSSVNVFEYLRKKLMTDEHFGKI